MVWDGITKGDLGLEWCGMGLQKETWDWNDFIPFRCLPIYRHLKKEKSKERNKCSLIAARKHG